MAFDRKQAEKDYLDVLENIVNDPILLDAAVKERASVKVGEKTVALSAIEVHGVFDKDGNINETACEKWNIKFDKPRIQGFLKGYSLQKVSDREGILLEALFFSASITFGQQYAELLLKLNADADHLKENLVKDEAKNKKYLEAEEKFVATKDEIYKSIPNAVFTSHLSELRKKLESKKRLDNKIIQKPIPSDSFYASIFKDREVEVEREENEAKYVNLEQFYKTSSALNTDRAILDQRKNEFIRDAMQLYDSLSVTSKKSVAKHVYTYILDNLQRIKDDIIKLKENKSINVRIWKLLQNDLDRLINLEKDYAKRIGSTFLEFDLIKLKMMLNGNLSDIKVTANKKDLAFAKNQSEQEERLNIRYLVNLMEHPAKPHPIALEDIPGFKKRKTNYTDQLKKIFQNHLNDLIIQFNQISQSSTLKEGMSFLEIFQQMSKYANQLKVDSIPLHDLKHFELLLDDLNKHESTARFIYKKLPDYSSNVLRTIQEKTKTAEAAKQFLENAKIYLNSPERNWGLNKPKNVLLQLAEIDKAEKNGKYVKHKTAFLNIGINKKSSFFTTRASNQYFALFRPTSKKVEQIEKDLEKIFTAQPKQK